MANVNTPVVAVVVSTNGHGCRQWWPSKVATSDDPLSSSFSSGSAAGLVVPQGCAMGIQAVSLECLGHTEPVEHAADAVDAEAPERTFAVLVHQVPQSTQLLHSSWVQV